VFSSSFFSALAQNVAIGFDALRESQGLVIFAPSSKAETGEEEKGWNRQ
jgi:hypothetical protein